MIAALYIDPRGPYPKMANVDCWDADRDARKYAGPYPVVAHPPCHLWTNFAFVNFKRWGGEHNRPGNDGGAFEAALRSVRQFGGVLEHPAFSHAWAKFRLMRPLERGWNRVGARVWVCEVWQSAYGHRAQKRTWLYYVGRRPPLQAKWARRAGSHQCGFHDQRGKDRNKPTVGKAEASRTPVAFSRFLVRLARQAMMPAKRADCVSTG